MPPNAKSCLFGTAYGGHGYYDGDRGITPAAIIRGVNCVMGDGSVKFASDNIDVTVGGVSEAATERRSMPRSTRSSLLSVVLPLGRLCRLWRVRSPRPSRYELRRSRRSRRQIAEIEKNPKLTPGQKGG